MAPVNKQKRKKTPTNNDKDQHEAETMDERVVSGQLQKKINKYQRKVKRDPKGIVLLKHLPHGFFEEQLMKYLEQFGKVTRVRLVRSTLTGRSKGYAYVEFEHPEVAEVVAETMDNYLMFKKVVKAVYIPPEQQKFNYFRTSLKQIRSKSGKLIWVSKKTAAIQQKVKKQNDWSEENFQKRTQKQLEKLKTLEKKYTNVGIDISQLVLRPKTLENEIEPQENSNKKEKRDNKSDCKLKRTKRKISKDVVGSKKQSSKFMEI